MLQQGKPDDYVLAGEKTYTVRDFVTRAFMQKGYRLKWSGSGRDEVAKDQCGTVRVKVNPEYYRTCEVDFLLGDASKAKTKLYWKREFDSLDKLIRDMFM